MQVTMSNRPPMTMAQFYTHCNHCPFLHMPSKCKRAQKLDDYCPGTGPTEELCK